MTQGILTYKWFNVLLDISPNAFPEPLKYWKEVRIYKLTIRPISNVTFGNKEENILHYLKLFLFYSFSLKLFIIPLHWETIKIANLHLNHFFLGTGRCNIQHTLIKVKQNTCFYSSVTLPYLIQILTLPQFNEIIKIEMTF